MMRSRLTCSALLLLSLAFSGIASAQSNLSIDKAKVKQIASGAYRCTMDLQNNGTADALITRVSSPQFGKARLVKPDFSAGYQTMAGVLVEAGEKQSLSRRGVQVLLTQPSQAIATTELTLHYADNSQQTLLLSFAANATANPAASGTTQVVPTKLEKEKPKKKKRYRQKHNPASR